VIANGRELLTLTRAERRRRGVRIPRAQIQAVVAYWLERYPELAHE